MTRILPALCALALLFTPACSGAAKRSAPYGPDSISARAELESDTVDYVLVYLRRGPSAESRTEEQRAATQSAHLAEIERMARHGDLLVAGPFDAENTHPEIRGIYVLDVQNLDFARGLSLSDPAVQAGVLVPELLTWQGDRALRDVHAQDLESMSTDQAATEEGAVFNMRRFVLVDAVLSGDAEPALAQLRSRGEMLFFGRVTGGAERRAIFLLDAGSVEQAMSLLAAAGNSITNVQAIPWWGSANLARLPEMR
jgi:uncharacterized protein YciI